MKINLLTLLLVCAIRIYPQALNAGKPAPNEVQNQNLTREQGDAILSELKQIRQLLERQQLPPVPPEPTVLKGSIKVSSNDRFLGDPKAPLTMVEFTDYQCPFCKEFHKSTFQTLKKDFIDTGKLRFVSRDMPLDFHQNAQYAAEAARCAGEQGKFWQMRELLFENSPRFTGAEILGYAANLKLNDALFQNCVSTHKFEVDVRLNLAQAGSLKIQGTPAFLIGATTPEGVDGQIVEGAMPVEVFTSVLNGILAKIAQ